LVKLHRQVIYAVQRHNRTQVQWQILPPAGPALGGRGQEREQFRPQFLHFPSSEPPSWVGRYLYTPTAVCSVCAWSGLSAPSSAPDPSCPCLLSSSTGREGLQYLYIQVACSSPFSFLCTCVYSTVFRIRVFNYYYLAPHHQTDAYSLQFSGMLFCRLTPPLCLNFLEQTAYTSIMGSMRVLSFIANGFYIYYPHADRHPLHRHLLQSGDSLPEPLGFQQFVGDSEMTSDLIDEGRELIRREKRKRQRIEDGENRRRRRVTLRGTNMELLQDAEPLDYNADTVEES
ncbi:hypothetical protein KUCAC02_035262, partial [Chaenocephalus aceratus]